MDWSKLTDEQIDARIDKAAATIADIEFNKRLRRTARDNSRLRQYETEDISLLKLAGNGEKVTIDRVPPRLRREVLNRQT
jgi:hypothetical protein